MYNKVELCGVDTAKLPVLTEEQKHDLLLKIRNGTPAERKSAREEMINGNLRLFSHLFSPLFSDIFRIISHLSWLHYMFIPGHCQ